MKATPSWKSCWGSGGESFVNSKGGTFGALATSNSFADSLVEGLTLNNGGTLIALARANSEANTSVFFEFGTNSGTIVAKAGGLDGGFSNAILRLDVGELNNSGGTIFASATGGGSAIVDITGSEIFGGLLKTTVGTGTLPGRPQAWIGVFGSGGSGQRTRPIRPTYHGRGCGRERDHSGEHRSFWFGRVSGPHRRYDQVRHHDRSR